MNNKWDVEFCSDQYGNCEIADWFMKLKVSQRDKVIAWIDKLQVMGPLLPWSYANILRDGIHELRVKVSGNQVRILYFFVYENRIVLSHPFYKNFFKVPEKEIKKTIQLREEYIERSGK